MTRRGGYSLLELMVALAIGFILLLLARLTVQQVADAAALAEESRVDAARRANGEALLRALLRRTDPPAVRPGAVAGGPARAVVHTWCDVPAGWLEPCTATLRVVPRAGDGETKDLVLEIPGASLSVLAGQPAGTHLLYLADPAWGGRWVESWGARLSNPFALGIAAGGDTLIVRLGGAE